MNPEIPASIIGSQEAVVIAVIISLLLGAFKVATRKKGLTAGKAEQTGSLVNRLLPVVAVVIGVLFAFGKAWFSEVPFRSVEMWDLLLWGVLIGWAASGSRGLTRTTLGGK